MIDQGYTEGALTRDEWLQWRRSGITATEVADAANDTYGGAYAVIANKLGLTATEVTEPMRRGERWQAPIADAVHALTGWHVLAEEACVTCETDERWLATVDGFLAEHSEATFDVVAGVVEIKTRGADVRPPRRRWRDQVQWQLLVTGLPAGLIAEATIDDTTDTCRSLVFELVEADPYRQAELVEVAEALWAHYTAGSLPEPTSSSLDTVKLLTGAGDLEGSADLQALELEVERLQELRAAVKELETERDRVEGIVRAGVGDFTEGTTRNYRVRVSPPARKVPADTLAQLAVEFPELCRPVLDIERLKAERPDVYEASRKPAGGRRLTITPL
jgi:predicted phage-related endonuclease